jgi:hypothetical protein
MLEHLDGKLGWKLRKEWRLALLTYLGCRGGRSGPGEVETEHVREGGSFCGLLGAETLRGGGALAGGGAESG